MKMGIIGLGKMGNAIADRVIQAGHDVYGFDLSQRAQSQAEEIGVQIAPTLKKIAEETRIIWLMVPTGDPVDQVIKALVPYLKGGDIIIDGGNSNYLESIRRSQALQLKDIFFLDCGTSGGIRGRADGFCLMVGGDLVPYTKVHQLFAAIAAPGGVAHVGPTGAGHYVKMVHNGIEYGLLQAYAEGFHVLREGSFKDAALNLEEISRIWNTSSVIRSFILDLCHDIFIRDQKLEKISGQVVGTGMGKWTVEEAQKHKIPVPIIEGALKQRAWSQETGGNYATKIIAMLRNKFGGHQVKKIKESL